MTIKADEIQAIISLYEKHGWVLRRILLTEVLRKSLGDSLTGLFGQNEIVNADIDAAWFSRPSGHDKEAWELRRLSQTPYALFEVFDSTDEEETRDATRQEMEAKLLNG